MLIGQSVGAVAGGLLATWLETATAMAVLATLSVVVTVALTPGLRRSADRRASSTRQHGWAGAEPAA